MISGLGVKGVNQSRIVKGMVGFHVFTIFISQGSKD